MSNATDMRRKTELHADDEAFLNPLPWIHGTCTFCGTSGLPVTAVVGADAICRPDAEYRLALHRARAEYLGELGHRPAMALEIAA